MYPSNFLYLGNLFYFFILGFASIVFGKIKFFEINLYAISIVLLIQIYLYYRKNYDHILNKNIKKEFEFHKINKFVIFISISIVTILISYYFFFYNYFGVIYMVIGESRADYFHRVEYGKIRNFVIIPFAFFIYTVFFSKLIFEKNYIFKLIFFFIICFLLFYFTECGRRILISAIFLSFIIFFHYRNISFSFKFAIKFFISTFLLIMSVLFVSEFFLEKRTDFFEKKRANYSIPIAERVNQYDFLIPILNSLDKQNDLDLFKINSAQFKNFKKFYNEYEFNNPVLNIFLDKTSKNLSRRPTPFYEVNNIINSSNLIAFHPPNFKILSDSFFMAIPSMFIDKKNILTEDINITNFTGIQKRDLSTNPLLSFFIEFNNLTIFTYFIFIYVLIITLNFFINLLKNPSIKMFSVILIFLFIFQLETTISRYFLLMELLIIIFICDIFLNKYFKKLLSLNEK